MKQLGKVKRNWLISIMLALVVIGGAVYAINESRKPKFTVTIVEDHKRKSYGVNGGVPIVMTISLAGVDYAQESPDPVTIKKITIDDNLNLASSERFGPYVTYLGRGFGISRKFGLDQDNPIYLRNSAQKVEIETTDGTVTVTPIIEKINEYKY